MAIIGRGSQGAKYLREAGRYSTGTQDLEKNPPCNAEDNLRAGLIVKPGSGATEGVPD